MYLLNFGSMVISFALTAKRSPCLFLDLMCKTKGTQVGNLAISFYKYLTSKWTPSTTIDSFLMFARSITFVSSAYTSLDCIR